MSKINVSNGQLMNYARDLRDIQSSVLGVILQSKIKEFVNANGLRMDTITTKVNGLITDHFVGPEFKDLVEGKTKEEFEQKMQELMAQENTIEI